MRSAGPWLVILCVVASATAISPVRGDYRDMVSAPPQAASNTALPPDRGDYRNLVSDAPQAGFAAPNPALGGEYRNLVSDDPQAASPASPPPRGDFRSWVSDAPQAGFAAPSPPLGGEYRSLVSDLPPGTPAAGFGSVSLAGLYSSESPAGPAADVADNPNGVDYARSGIYVQADALFLQRVPRWIGQRLVVDTAGVPLLSTNDLGLPLAGAPRFLLGFYPDADSSGELVYFGLHNWNVGETVTSAHNLRLPGDISLLTTDFLQADQMRVDSAAQLHNVEINGVFHRPGVSWLAGFRYMNLDERFDIHAKQFNTEGSDYRIRTWNNLFGGQVGARVERQWEKFAWDLTGKLGVFANACGQSTFLGDFNNTFVLRDFTRQHVQAAVNADFSLNAAWRLSDVWSLRGGYNLMLLDGLALGPDQLDFSANLRKGGQVTDTGGLFLHGVHVGLEAKW